LDGLAGQAQIVFQDTSHLVAFAVIRVDQDTVKRAGRILLKQQAGTATTSTKLSTRPKLSQHNDSWHEAVLVIE
jgi:hypothetical protein